MICSPLSVEHDLPSMFVTSLKSTVMPCGVCGQRESLSMFSLSSRSNFEEFRPDKASFRKWIGEGTKRDRAKYLDLVNEHLTTTDDEKRDDY